MIKYKIIVSVVWFILLYLIALISARGMREEDTVLGVSNSQWHAIVGLWLPVLALFLK